MFPVIEFSHNDVVLCCFNDTLIVNKPTYSLRRDRLVREAPRGLQAPLDNRVGQEHWEGRDQWERRASQ